MKKSIFVICLATFAMLGCSDEVGNAPDGTGTQVPVDETTPGIGDGTDAGNPQQTTNPQQLPGGVGDGGHGNDSGDGGKDPNPGDGEKDPNPGGGDETHPGEGGDETHPGEGGDETHPGEGGDETHPGEGDDETHPGDGGDGSKVGDVLEPCCEGITGAKSGRCVNNKCQIESCEVGYHLNAKKACAKDTKLYCGADVVNCNSLIDTQGYEHAAVMACTLGQCVIKTCMEDYELHNGRCGTGDEEDPQEYGGGVNCRAGWISVSPSEMKNKLCYAVLTDEAEIENVDSLTPNLPKSGGKYTQYYCMKGEIEDRYCRHIPNEYNPESMLVVHPGQYCTKEQANPGNDTLRVHMMDIGQGDSIWIQTPTGQNVLIDGGDAGAFGKTAAGPIVTDYLNSHGFPYGSTFDLVILTHPHADHFGGFNNIFNVNNKTTHYRLANYLDPMDYEPNNPSVKLPSGYIQWTGRVKTFLPEKNGKKNAHIYMPAQDYFKAGQSFPKEFFGSEVTTQYILSHNTYNGDDANPASIIFKLSYKGVSFLFTGDAEKAQEKEAVATGIDLNSNFLKVCHHGSSTSSSTTLLDAVWKKVAEESRFALISSGRQPYSGAFIPTSEVVLRLKQYLTEDHIFSTSAGDDHKTENESYRDDNILVVVKPDGSYYACFNGTN